MAFEIFKETGTRTREFISVTETKAFGLSRAFLDKHDITSDHKAVIFYDPETNRVALHFSENNPKFGFAVRIANEKHGATIMAKSFFDLKGLDSKRYAGRYGEFEKMKLADIGITDKQGDVFVVSLKEREPESEQISPESTDDVVVDDAADQPINLEDIPF